MNMGVAIGDVNSGHYYTNSPTVPGANNHNSIYFTKKSDEIAPNRSKIENSGLQYGFEIDVMLPASTLHQYDNMEYNN